MSVKMMRVFCGTGRYKYHTAIGDFNVDGETGRWKLFRGGRQLGDFELLSEVETAIHALITHHLSKGE